MYMASAAYNPNISSIRSWVLSSPVRRRSVPEKTLIAAIRNYKNLSNTDPKKEEYAKYIIKFINTWGKGAAPPPTPTPPPAAPASSSTSAEAKNNSNWTNGKYMLGNFNGKGKTTHIYKFGNKYLAKVPGTNRNYGEVKRSATPGLWVRTNTESFYTANGNSGNLLKFTPYPTGAPVAGPPMPGPPVVPTTAITKVNVNGTMRNAVMVNNRRYASTGNTNVGNRKARSYYQIVQKTGEPNKYTWGSNMSRWQLKNNGSLINVTKMNKFSAINNFWRTEYLNKKVVEPTGEEIFPLPNSVARLFVNNNKYKGLTKNNNKNTNKNVPTSNKGRFWQAVNKFRSEAAAAAAAAGGSGAP
jgi:hypothetical protein